MSADTACVLDSSALLAFFFDEPGAEVVETALGGPCHVSMINWVEVLTRASETGHDPQFVESHFRQEGILDKTLLLKGVTRPDCIRIAQLRTATKAFGVGLGGRACLALGLRMGLPIVTAEAQWANLDIGATIKLIR